MKKLLIYGASGHGKVIADIALLNGYEEIIFYDDDKNKNFIDKYEITHEFPEDDYDLIVAIGDNDTREKISLKTDKKQVTLIHPEAVVARDVEIGEGCTVMARAVINSGSRLGKGVIVNTCASVDHDNIIEDYVHVSVNAHTAGNVKIGKRSFIGMGALVINNITIVEDTTVGAGAVIVEDINEKGTYAGVPARKIK